MQVVVGAGISGLVTAALLARHLPKGSVAVVEPSVVPGGLLQSFDYGRDGRFDHGTHLMADTGVAELDDFLRGLLPPEEWVLLDGVDRDVAGAWYQGRLQANSPYLDLRSLPQEEHALSLASVLGALGRPAPNAADSAAAHARARFGRAVADAHVLPALASAFGGDPEDLDRLAGQVAPMDRVVLVDEDAYGALVPSEIFRERVAFPEQRRLPVTMGERRRAYYPRRRGIGRVIDALVERLHERDARLLFGWRVESVRVDGGRVDEVSVSSGSSNLQLPASGLYWAAGLPSLAGHLSVDAVGRPEPGLTTVIVNVAVEERPDTGGTYYFYCYEPGTATFRVTNYAEYCEEASDGPRYPLSMELLVPPGDASDPDLMVRLALDELRRFGVIDPERSVPFVRSEALTKGFPRMSVQNVALMTELREALAMARPGNLQVIGGFARDRQFFQRDVLRHAFEVLQPVIDQGMS